MYSNRKKEPHKVAPPNPDVELLKSNIVHELSDEELEKLYMWVDGIPLSRQKRNMNRDFSDGAAELIKFFLPRIVDLHNYSPTSSNRQKADNWYHLNRKVLIHMNLEISQDLIDDICAGRPNVIQSLLSTLRDRIDLYLAGQAQRPSRRRRQYDVSSDMRPEADQDSRGYVPSAEGFHQDGHYHSPTTRRMYPEYSVPDPPSFRSSPVKQLSHRGPHANGEMLPKGLLDEREVAIENREQTITMLQAKIQRLEQLLTLKDIRIDDLSQKLDQLTQPVFHNAPAPRGSGAGLSNRLANQRGTGRHQVASHGGRY